MKLNSTTFLRLAIIGVGLLVLLICGLLFPALLSEDDLQYRLLLLGMYATAIPFYIAAYQTMRLLGFVDAGTAFSLSAVTALQRIKYCATAVSAIYTALLPVFFYAADTDDAPGVMVIGLALVTAPLIVAVFAAVLQKLLKSAIDIKSENDLTV